MALLKYELKCTDDTCSKRVIVLVDQDEQDLPCKCPFCSADVLEVV